MMRVFISLMALVLSACATTTTVQSQHYLLPYPKQVIATAQPTFSQPTARLKSISLPSYLQKQNIVLVDNNGQVFQAANHFWAEPLESQLEGATLTYLSDRLPSINWLSPAQYQMISDYLTIHLEKFYADPEGQVSVAGYWTLWSQENKLLKQQRFEFHDVMTDDGYLAMTQALANVWFQSVLETMIADFSQR